MSAEIIRLPVRLSPRLVNETSTDDVAFHEWELQTAERFLDACALAVRKAREGQGQADLVEAARAGEGLLFHLLTAAGALNADLPLRRMLATRQAERITL